MNSFLWTFFSIHTGRQYSFFLIYSEHGFCRHPNFTENINIANWVQPSNVCVSGPPAERVWNLERLFTGQLAAKVASYMWPWSNFSAVSLNLWQCGAPATSVPVLSWVRLVGHVRKDSPYAGNVTKHWKTGDVLEFGFCSFVHIPVGDNVRPRISTVSIFFFVSHGHKWQYCLLD